MILLKDIADLRDAIQFSHLSSDRTWDLVIKSLRQIAEVLKNWGRLLSNVAPQLDIPSLRDMADGLDAFDQLLDDLQDLEKWFKRQPEVFWQELWQGLNVSRNTYWTQEVRGAFSLYLRTQHQREMSSQEIKGSDQARFEVGKNLIQYGKAIDDAICAAQAYRRG